MLGKELVEGSCRALLMHAAAHTAPIQRSGGRRLSRRLRWVWNQRWLLHPGGLGVVGGGWVNGVRSGASVIMSVGGACG